VNQRLEDFFGNYLLADKFDRKGDSEVWSRHQGIVKDALEFVVRTRSVRKLYEKSVVQLVASRYGSFIAARPPTDKQQDMETVRSILNVLKLLLLIDRTVRFFLL
jgi:hypothetical protein